jgi:hypothetical protein
MVAISAGPDWQVARPWLPKGPIVSPSRDRLPAADLQLQLLLASGGDERISLDPLSRRNRYGTPAGPAPDEIWLSSSTASAITPAAYRAAAAALARLVAAEPQERLDLDGWFDDLRRRLCAMFAVPGSAVVLAASGTETELLTLALVRSYLRRPIVNIVVAPTETGSGVALAAAGRHFLSSTAWGGRVEAGAPLAGWGAWPCVETIAIRDPDGRPRSAAAVDSEAAARVAAALARDCDVVLHVLDVSKTGLFGISRTAARALAAAAGERIAVVVDACQLRCSAAQIRDDLRFGHMVMISGSKFAGGPAFSGALLVPPACLERVGRLGVETDLAAYSAVHDWPPALRPRLGLRLGSLANLGLGLRWEAALFEFEAFVAIDEAVSRSIAAMFETEVQRRIAAAAWLRPLDKANAPLGGFGPTIVPVRPAGHAGLAYLESIHRGLRSRQAVAGRGGRVCHVGQPVAIGETAAVRLCISAPMMNAVAGRLRAGQNLARAFQPIGADLDWTFDKWEALARP